MQERTAVLLSLNSQRTIKLRRLSGHYDADLPFGLSASYIHFY